MLDVLFDGRDHPVGELARAAGIGSSTAVGHVAELEQGGIVVSRREGRRRLVRLSGPDASAALEALAALATEPRPSSLHAWTHREQLKRARTCYDHLAGKLGVAVADAALTAGALNADLSLGSSASAWFARIGVDLEAIPARRRPLIRICTDWTERREHLAGSLGATVCA
jgi:DNA-binding MarR family transcriptional regulator